MILANSSSVVVTSRPKTTFALIVSLMQNIDLGRTKKAWINLNVFFVIAIELFKQQNSSDHRRSRSSSGPHEVIRLMLSEQLPHPFHVLARLFSVLLGINVAKKQYLF